MKNTALLVFVLLFCPFSWSKEFKCKEHSNSVLLGTSGKEHVNHSLMLNGKVLIKELSEQMWFVEQVKCTSRGFEIVASHAQYGDQTKRTFVLTVTGAQKYEIK